MLILQLYLKKSATGPPPTLSRKIEQKSLSPRTAILSGALGPSNL
nr:MAG TPA: hypothetical protein [Caudoviricetes sp.]